MMANEKFEALMTILINSSTNPNLNQYTYPETLKDFTNKII